MSGDYSISLNGFFSAERTLLQSAQRIAAARMPDPADLVGIEQAKISAEANLKLISAKAELDHEVLDLFA